MSDNSTQRQDSGIDSGQLAEDTGFQFGSTMKADGGSGSSADQSDDVTLEDVQEVVTDRFDEDMWRVTEAILASHATLLIDSVDNCTGLVIVGESGAGKTTAIRFLEGLDEQTYRSDEMTPASFVSHDASRSGEELAEVDLLPRIKHRTLTSRDMATWFSGEGDAIYSRMSRMAHLMDGEGLTRDSGSHGKRGYEGDDYRFTLIGATTPLSPRAWKVMGHTGQRFVFHEKSRTDADWESVREDVFGDTSYMERVRECREVVHRFLQTLWEEHGGYKEVDTIDVTEDAGKALYYLAKVVRYSRATLENGHGETDVRREGIHRIVTLLRDVAEGKALLDGRTTVEVEDVQVSARIALSTMPARRRPLVRALLNPANDGELTTTQARDALGTSRPTAITRMELMETLELAHCATEEGDGRNPKRLTLYSEFQWPDTLEFPRLDSR